MGQGLVVDGEAEPLRFEGHEPLRDETLEHLVLQPEPAQHGGVMRPWYMRS